MKIFEIAPNIEVNPKILGGKPCISGKRVPVWVILEWLEEGYSIEEILEELEILTREDIQAAIRYVKIISKEQAIRINEISS